MKILGDISSRQMTRSEFIKFVLMLAIAAFGFGNLIASLTKQRQAQSDSPLSQQKGSGFGSSKFGV